MLHCKIISAKLMCYSYRITVTLYVLLLLHHCYTICVIPIYYSVYHMCILTYCITKRCYKLLPRHLWEFNNDSLWAKRNEHITKNYIVLVWWSCDSGINKKNYFMNILVSTMLEFSMLFLCV